ncbi:class I SAM-dependent methyltransferase [Flavobacteriaceae bacterium AH-315-B10]|nr:class I SAM-dependent methyltransferase [Flavobacteriaceae bacterium AH-315-B10]
MSNIKQHWNNVYETKNDDELSWYQENPTSSLNLITALNLSNESEIIDVGGGNSNLTKALQKQGFVNLSVLDISIKVLEHTKTKLGENGKNINWIVSDILDFKHKQKYDLWHDRATFHFLTNKSDIVKYVTIAGNAINNNGYLVLATFSKTGPKKCSGLDIMQYDKEKLQELFREQFILIKSFEEVHQTLFKTEQNFIYNLFQKR